MDRKQKKTNIPTQVDNTKQLRTDQVLNNQLNTNLLPISKKLSMFIQKLMNSSRNSETSVHH